MTIKQDTSLLWLFRSFSHMYHRYTRTQMDRRGLSQVSHPHILFSLRRIGGTATQKELADMLGISAPTVAVSIKRMVKAGILEKTQDSTDLRRNFITITPKGSDLIDQTIQAFNQIDKDVFEGFTQSELDILASYYRRMLANVESKGGQMPSMLKKRGTEHT